MVNHPMAGLGKSTYTFFTQTIWRRERYFKEAGISQTGIGFILC